jgi:membrane dipeptidase
MDPESKAIHEAAIVIDGLEISRFSRPVFEGMRKGGLTAVNCTVSVLESFHRTIMNIAWWQKAFTEHADLIRQVRSVSDIHAAKTEGKTGIILGFQNTSAIENNLDLLSIFHALGVRVIQLTYMEANLAGQGCLERFDAGLTNFGLEVIKEMNRLGILIDLSHVGHRTAMEAIEASARPVAFTHANPRSLCDHPRNKTDEEIKALVKRGGVIGATIFPPFLPSGNLSTVHDVVKVVDYLVEMVGIDHVGIGTDFTEGQPREFFDWLLTGKFRKEPAMHLDFPLKLPEGIQGVADFPNLTAALQAAGYAEGDLRKILGGNFLRLFSEVWKEETWGGGESPTARGRQRDS